MSNKILPIDFDLEEVERQLKEGKQDAKSHIAKIIED